jgi:maltose O-acetyltransferase
MAVMRRLKAVMRRLITLLLSGLANAEVHWRGDARDGFFRKIHFRFLRIKWRRPMAVGHHVFIRNTGNLQLGQRCAVGSFAQFWNYAPISIGDDFMSAGGLVINSATHDPVTLESIGKPVDIGQRVWCGQNVTILAGVVIGDDVVIGAGSVVIHSIPSNSIAVGVPARVIKPLVRDKPPMHPLFMNQNEP